MNRFEKNAMQYRAIEAHSPFHYHNTKAYQQWKKQKLSDYPHSIEQLVVPLKDPMALSSNEVEQLRYWLARANMVIYAMDAEKAEDKSVPEAIGQQLGIHSLDKNECADHDGFTSLQVVDAGLHTLYIPYSNKGINWHTDGYYNRLSEQIFSMLLHCVRPAQSGGENRLMDHDCL